MMQVWICEDDEVYRASLQQTITAWAQQTNRPDLTVTAFHSSEELLEAWTSGQRADLLLLDIEIPNELSGLELARRIRLSDPDVPIVFITHFDEYVYQGYTVSALRYLRKPVAQADLFPCLEIAYQHYRLFHQDHFVLRMPGEQFVIRYADLLYIEAQSPNLRIRLLNDPQEIVVRYPLKRIFELLPADLFSLCHRSYIVSLAQIRILRKTQAVLCNGETLPISEKHVDELFRKFNLYHQKGCC